MNAKKMIAVNVIVLIILIGGAFAGYYFYDQASNYVKTEDAKIEGKMITIEASADGELTDWNGKVGETFKGDDTVGKIETQTEKGKEKQDVTIPHEATIVKDDAVLDSTFGAGTRLAQAFNLDDLWVTANIDEKDIDHVKEGKDVDIVLDSFKDTTLSGEVEQIGFATKDTFALLPSSDSDDDAVIPVKISLNDYKGLRLVPGMNAKVKIDR